MPRLTPERLARVQSLLAEGRLSQRKIAKLIGCSRGVVDSIAAGTYRPREIATLPVNRSGIPYPPLFVAGRPARGQRCRGCGGRYVGPRCFLCYVRDCKAAG